MTVLKTACIIWDGPLDDDGYGRMAFGKLAHKHTWEQENGPVPAGLELDHRCRIRVCINLEHLEPVTHAENMRRSARAQQTHCYRGHPFNEANTYRHPRGGRKCRACNLESVRRYQERSTA